MLATSICNILLPLAPPNIYIYSIFDSKTRILIFKMIYNEKFTNVLTKKIIRSELVIYIENSLYI